MASPVAGLTVSRVRSVWAGTKFAVDEIQNRVHHTSWLVIPSVLVGVPFIPCWNRFKDVKVAFWYDAGNNEGLLTVERVGVSQIDAEDTQQGPGDVPGCL